MFVEGVPEVPAGSRFFVWFLVCSFPVLPDSSTAGGLPEDNVLHKCVPDALLSPVGEIFFLLRDEDGGKQSQEDD